MSSDSSFANNSDFKTSLDSDLFFLNYAKIIVVGDPSVGKSSIILSYTESQFKYNLQATCGVDFSTKTIKLDDRNELKMQIWDTAGQEKYRSLIAHYFKNAHGALLVFDLASRKSFEAIKTCWLENLKKFAPEKICKVVLANKCDKVEEIEVENEEIQKFERDFNIICYRTSAKESLGISEAFHSLAKLMNENFFLLTSSDLKNKGTFEKTVGKMTEIQESANGIKISVSKERKKNKKSDLDQCC